MCEFAQMIISLKFLPKDFTTFEDPFYKFFALNLLFQDTSYNLALKYSSFLVLYFIILLSDNTLVGFLNHFTTFRTYFKSIWVLNLDAKINIAKTSLPKIK